MNTQTKLTIAQRLTNLENKINEIIKIYDQERNIHIASDGKDKVHHQQAKKVCEEQAA